MQGCLWFLQSAKVQREAESSAIKLLSLLPPVATLSARKLYEQMAVMPALTISGETLMVLLKFSNVFAKIPVFVATNSAGNCPQVN